MSYPIELERLLIAAPPETPLRVSHILYAEVRDRCADRGVHEGDELRRLETTHDHVVVDVPPRGRVRLELKLATCVEVEPSDFLFEATP